MFLGIIHDGEPGRFGQAFVGLWLKVRGIIYTRERCRSLARNKFGLALGLVSWANIWLIVCEIFGVFRISLV